MAESRLQDAYSTMKELENLRRCIQEKLAAVSPNWWKERVPNDVQRKAEERREKNERLYPWHAERDLPLIFHVDFSDYSKIILRRDDWDQVFAPIFKDKEVVSAKLRELEPIRNALAHFRALKPPEVQKLKLYSKEIIVCITSS